jgi:hypothetical protein
MTKQQKLWSTETNINKEDAIDHKEVKKEQRRTNKYKTSKCPCGKNMIIQMPRTTHDGRTCIGCGKRVLTCHFCNKIICDWLDESKQPNDELTYMPNICPHCKAILMMVG